MDKHIVTEHTAKLIWEWLQTRGGIAVWSSINLSNPSGSWTTPATLDGKPYPKPTWQAANEPRIITDTSEVLVSIDREVKRFHVAVEQRGLSIKVTEGGSRRIWKEVAKAGKNAYHLFDYSTQDAIIFASDRLVPIAEYIASQQGGKLQQ